jgi:exopolyphosphatase/guanosine-5'-triphosphate,3'-diphosphate pyrophosphatase
MNRYYNVMPRYAAIDIGSNSVRLQVAEVVPGAPVKILSADREVTRIGASVFSAGVISKEALDFVSAVLARMADTYQKFDVSAIRAVATSAVRDASNQAEFAIRASEAAGTPIEIISGAEEARLIHMGVQSRWPHPKQRVITVDVGGGSAELILAENGALVEGISRPLGAVRLTENFLKNDPPSGTDLHRLEKFIDEKIEPAFKRIGSAHVDRVIATSATAAAIVCAINRIPRARREEADRLRATTSQVRAFYRDLSARDLNGRKKIAGIGPRRAEIITAGTAVFLRILERFHLPSVYYSSAGVRDGIIADLAARGAGRELSRLSREQLRVVEAMSRKYGVEVKHGRKVAAIGHTLFDTLHPIHKLPPTEGKLLEAAAYLHDTGHFVSDTAHHKHSAYLVQNSDMPGFTDTERRMIGLLCRYHRKSMPAARHDQFQSLPPDAKKTVQMLAPLLRIADGLDSGREQKIEDVECHLGNGSVSLVVNGKGDLDLETWAGERAIEVFRQVYNLPISLVRAKR